MISASVAFSWQCCTLSENEQPNDISIIIMNETLAMYTCCTGLFYRFNCTRNTTHSNTRKQGVCRSLLMGVVQFLNWVEWYPGWKGSSRPQGCTESLQEVARPVDQSWNNLLHGAGVLRHLVGTSSWHKYLLKGVAFLLSLACRIELFANWEQETLLGGMHQHQSKMQGPRSGWHLTLVLRETEASTSNNSLSIFSRSRNPYHYIRMDAIPIMVYSDSLVQCSRKSSKECLFFSSMSHLFDPSSEKSTRSRFMRTWVVNSSPVSQFKFPGKVLFLHCNPVLLEKMLVFGYWNSSWTIITGCRVAVLKLLCCALNASACHVFLCLTGCSLKFMALNWPSYLHLYIIWSGRSHWTWITLIVLGMWWACSLLSCCRSSCRKKVKKVCRQVHGPCSLLTPAVHSPSYQQPEKYSWRKT